MQKRGLLLLLLFSPSTQVLFPGLSQNLIDKLNSNELVQIDEGVLLLRKPFPYHL
jgi:hypothetical protein